MRAAGIGLLSMATPPRWRPSSRPLHGMADLHVHLGSHLGFGGRLFTGEPDHPDGIMLALADCTRAHGIGGTGFTGTNAPILTWIESTGSEPTIHFGHRTNGYPKFDGWPRFTSVIHQQGHIDWIKRAHSAGLRLIVGLVVNNRLLADIYGGQRSATDRDAVHDQVEYMKALAGRHDDFMEVAFSPSDARRIIRAGKLAVVIGVEVDQLGEFAGDASSAAVEQYLDYLHSIGVRYIFPIHLTNNVFGGAALYRGDMFLALQMYLNNEPFELTDGRSIGVEFRFGSILPALQSFLQHRFGRGAWHYESPPGSHTNALGLTPLGVKLLHALIKRRFIIDVDHMSHRALEDTLSLAEAVRYPLVSGHTGFRSLAWSVRGGETSATAKTTSETLKTDAQVERIWRLGGMIAPQVLQGDLRPAHSVDALVSSRNIRDCAGSSTAFAQAYLYAVAKMRGRGVGFGSDCNGFAQFPGPRFGPNAAYHLSNGQIEDVIRRDARADQVAGQGNGVSYQGPNLDWSRSRWTEGVRARDLTDEERDMWHAIGVIRSHCDVWADRRPDGEPGIAIPERVRNLAKGIAAGLNGSSDDRLERPGLFTGDAPWEQRAGWLLATGIRPGSGERDPDRVHALFRQLEPIWRQAQRMDGDNPPLTRSVAGERDFDINVDGFAHYGMLPDFIQDLRNIGLTEGDLEPLFSSAEAFVQMWERCAGERPPFRG